MKDSSIVLLQCLLLCGAVLPLAVAFQLGPSPLVSSFPKATGAAFPRRSAAWHLWESSGDGDAAVQRRRKRVKRKEPEPEESSPDSSAATAAARFDAPVKLAVRDVRDLVDGGTKEVTFTAKGPSIQPPAVTTTSSSNTGNKSMVSSSASRSGLSDDALKMLLQDAKEFQDKDNDSSDAAASSSGENGSSLAGSLRGILSTVVTVDFFVVCGFLLWFLAGIFCSYVLKDDTVQIAFNQLFQPVVQPALGILMIGAIAGSIGSKDEEY